MGRRKFTSHGGDNGSRDPLLSPGNFNRGSGNYGSIETSDSIELTNKRAPNSERTRLNESGSGHVLKKEFNLFYLFSLVTGAMIGSGIFISPIAFVQTTGSVAASLMFWVISGLLSVCVAICYSELATIFPYSGGEYNFYKHTFGDLMGFMFAWCNLITALPSMCALFAISTAEYILVYAFPTCQPPNSVTSLISIWIVVCVVALNCTYVSYIAKFQAVFTITKILTLVLIIVVGIVQLANGKTAILSTGFQGSNPHPASYVSAIYAGVFTYGGWQCVFVIMEEVKSPETKVPRATIFSMLLVTVLYTFTNVAYFTVMTPQDIMSSPAVAMTFAEKTIGMYSAIIPVLVACSTIGALNAGILGGSRVSFAAARDGLFPTALSAISTRYYTPWPSLILIGIMTTIYILTGSAVALMEYVGFIFMAVFSLSVFAVIYLRHTQPDLHRPFKTPLALAYFILVLNLILLLMGLHDSPRVYGIGVLLILSGLPLYGLAQWWTSKPPEIYDNHHKVTCIIEKLLLVVPPSAKP